MKIHSKYLNKDFEIANEKITHEELENIIINELGVNRSFKIKEIDDHPAVLCTLEKEERYIQTIGEASEDEKFPTVLAGERAFEKAALLYLNLETPVLETISYDEEQEEEIGIVAAPIGMDEETEDKDEETKEAEVVSEITEEVICDTEQTVEAETETVEEIAEEIEVVEETEVAPEIEEIVEETEVKAEEKVEEKTETEITPEPEPVPAKPVELKYGDPVVTIGKYRSKNMKVSEIIAENKSWAEWCINNMTTVTGNFKVQLDAMREQLELAN